MTQKNFNLKRNKTFKMCCVKVLKCCFEQNILTPTKEILCKNFAKLPFDADDDHPNADQQDKDHDDKKTMIMHT